jgi:membrane-bound lytic murein transglycosylase MltF
LARALLRSAEMLARLARPLLLLIPVLACRPSDEAAPRAAAERAAETRPPALRDLPEIEEEGKLRVIFTFNSTGYFIYRGEVMGFEFRLLRAFAEDHGLEIVLRVTRDRREVFDLLNGGAGDVIAARLLQAEVAKSRTDVLATGPLYVTPPVLVQEVAGMRDPRLPEPVEDVVEKREGREVAASEREEDRELRQAPKTPVQLRARLLTRPAQLAGKTVHHERGSPYLGLLAELQDRATGEIRIVELESARSSEKAIEQVATRGPRYTVAGLNIAQLQEEHYINIEAFPLLGPPEPVVWAVRGNTPRLLDALREWLAANPQRVASEYRTYFEERASFHERLASEYLTTATGRLSKYDDLLREQAREIDWDWRLLASQAFQNLDSTRMPVLGPVPWGYSRSCRAPRARSGSATCATPARTPPAPSATWTSSTATGSGTFLASTRRRGCRSCWRTTSAPATSRTRGAWRRSTATIPPPGPTSRTGSYASPRAASTTTRWCSSATRAVSSPSLMSRSSSSAIATISIS